MATPITVSIPQLLPNQRIEDWEPLFRASIGAIDPKVAVLLLPAHVHRREYEREIVLEAIKEESLDAAFELLRIHLDPPVDRFEATRKYYEMTWACGDYVDDFFGRMIKEAKRANHTNLQACTNLVTQLPQEVRSACRGWVRETEGDMTDREARAFMTKVRTIMTERGTPLDRGWRQADVVKVVEVPKGVDVHGSPESAESPEEQDEETPPRVYRARLDKLSQRPTWKRSDTRCFTCGAREHMWRQCPERSCGNCGRKGHGTGWCPRQEDNQRGGYAKRPVRGEKNKILIVGEGNRAHVLRNGGKTSDEDAVTLRVVIAGKEISAILDTGAKPSVMDRNTLAQLGLDDHIQPACNHVFGLGKAPVPIVGKVNVKVKIGRAEATTAIYVLDNDEPTLLLGREFMVCFDRVTFDFAKGRIGLGEAWTPIESTLTGGSALFRAQTALRDHVLAVLGSGSEEFDVAPELKKKDFKELARILEENRNYLRSTQRSQVGLACANTVLRRVTLHLLKKERDGCHRSGK